jgi:hypothetical protein
MRPGMISSIKWTGICAIDSIWGLHLAKGIDVGKGTLELPQADQEDRYWDWGVDEEDDVITWLPHFDPRHTD